MPHSTVNDIIQDSLGFIWLATDDGLARYDNHQFEVFQKQKDINRKISNNFVRTVFRDSKNEIWIGTSSSLEYYDKYNDKLIPFPVYDKEDSLILHVSCIFEYSDTSFLIGTDGTGLVLLNRNQIHSSFFVNDKLDKKIGLRISSICKDKFNRYWITTKENGWFVLNEACPFFCIVGNGKCMCCSSDVQLLRGLHNVVASFY